MDSDLGPDGPAYKHTYTQYTNKTLGALGCQRECDGDRECEAWTYVIAHVGPGSEDRCCRFHKVVGRVRVRVRVRARVSVMVGG